MWAATGPKPTPRERGRQSTAGSAVRDCSHLPLSVATITVIQGGLKRRGFLWGIDSKKSLKDSRAPRNSRSGDLPMQEGYRAQDPGHSLRSSPLRQAASSSASLDIVLLPPPRPAGPAHHHHSTAGTALTQSPVTGTWSASSGAALGWVPMLDQSSVAKGGRATWFGTVSPSRGFGQDSHMVSPKSPGHLQP